MKKLGNIFLISITVLVVFVGLVYLSLSETKDTFRTCELVNFDDAEKLDFSKYDSVLVAANTLYEASAFKEIMQGELYRAAWATPVKVPIVFLDSLKGGLTVIEQGGGNQTHSLELENPQGIRFTLRSLSKDPDKLIPEFAKEIGIENIVVDGIAAQHPYAALVVARLSKAIDLLHTNPHLVFVPKQDRLRSFNAQFGNRLYFLEFENKGKVDWTNITGVTELVDTDNLLELKQKLRDSLTIDQEKLIEARLLDLVIGDWDRHAKQWGWAVQKTQTNYIAIPIATDRDNAFFKIEGIVPSLVSNNMALPRVQSFEKNYAMLEGLIRPFDQYFLGSATRAQFIRAAHSVTNNLTDSVIAEAFTHWPASIDALDGTEIRETLKARRDKLAQTANNFYQILKDRPREEIVLNGCEDLDLSGGLRFCFDCN